MRKKENDRKFNNILLFISANVLHEVSNSKNKTKIKKEKTKKQQQKFCFDLYLIKVNGDLHFKSTAFIYSLNCTRWFVLIQMLYLKITSHVHGQIQIQVASNKAKCLAMQ